MQGTTHILLGIDEEYVLRAMLYEILQSRPKHLYRRMGLYGVAVDFFMGSVGPKFINTVFPHFQKVLSPIFSLIHFKVGFLHFAGKYRSDQDIAKYCYFYDFVD